MSRSSETMRRAREAPDYLVDSKNGAMINTNNQALRAYKMKREYDRKMVGVADRVERLEKDMGEIKSLLQILVERSA
jgi:hypothetical protein